jgi:hypothetical protein
MLQKLFQCNKTVSVDVVKHLMYMIENSTQLEDYDLSGASIAVSHPHGIGLYDTFLSIEQLTRCCKSSSFIPFVTHESAIDFYNNKMAMDGVFYYKPFMDQYQKKPLVITPWLVWLLVLGPPAAMALWLAARWTLPPGGEGGESSGGPQSIHSNQERH